MQAEDRMKYLSQLAIEYREEMRRWRLLALVAVAACGFMAAVLLKGCV